MDKSLTERIRSYLEGQISEAERNEFEQELLKNRELLSMTVLEQLLLDSMKQIVNERSSNALLKCQDFVGDTGMNLFSETDRDRIERFFSSVKVENYLLTDLMESFEVAEDFESYTTRSSTGSSQPIIQVLLPENEAEVAGTLNIELKTPVDHSLILNIRTNKGIFVLKNYILPPNQTSFSIELPQDLKPGRYYWQLKAAISNLKTQQDYGIALQSFFIEKRLMP
ncbi:MAG: hypothetical protein IPM47_12110 [Sphingobacteriales bacterium]|nr:MAG: hypothetical protein IPM47_12110 [Sphingobacteriales bacterium]